MKVLVLNILLSLSLAPTLSQADFCSDENNRRFTQATELCQNTTCSNYGSACNNVYIGTNPYMPGQLFFTSDYTYCGEGGGQWTGYWSELTPCSSQNGISVIKRYSTQVLKPQIKCGSIVRVEEQVLGEAIPLSGASFDLQYTSKFTNGLMGNFEGAVQLAGDTLETDISSFDVMVERDGLSTLNYNFLNNTLNRKLNLSWDGKNSSGLEIQGSKRFKVTVTEHRTYFDMPVVSEENLGGFRAHLLGIGGWAPSVYKFYDISSKRLYSMNGDVTAASSSALGAGQIYVASEDGGLVYVFDNSNGRHLFTKTGLTGANIYSFNYDGAGRLISVLEPFSRTTAFNRNLAGELISITSPRGQVTGVTLDVNGYLATVSNPNSETYSMTYSGVNGLLSSFQKPAGQVSTFSYDGEGLLISDSHSGGFFFDLVKNLSSSYKIDISSTTPMGRESKTQSNLSDTTIDRIQTFPSGMVNSYSYSNTGSAASEYVFTEQGAVSTSYVDDPRFPGMSQYANAISASANGVTRSYQNTFNVSLSNSLDPFSVSSWSNLAQVVSSNSAITTTYNPTSKKFSSTSYMGKTFETSIDSYERVTSQKIGSLYPVDFTYTNENLTKIKQNTRETNLAYNSTTGFLASVTNPLSQTTSFAYDSVGRVTAKTLPDSRIVGYSYDANGNVASITPPGKPAHYFNLNSQELASSYVPPTLSGVSVVNTAYTYNLDKQLTQITRPDGNSIDFNYNSATGILESYATPEGTYSLTYGGLYSKPSQVTNPDGSWTNIEYLGSSMIGSTNHDTTSATIASYNSTFASNALRDSDNVQNAAGTNSTISYLYNDDEDLKKAGDVNLTYNTPNGQLTGTTMGAGTTGFTDTYTYNSYGEVTGYQAKRGTTVIYDLTLTRDGMGRISGKSQTMNSITDAFVYTFDTTGRLTQTDKNSATVATYVYDDNSNRTGGVIGAQTTTATYDNQDRLNTYNTLSFTYNANGDLVSKTNNTLSQTTQYVYDVLGNLKQVTLPAGTVITYEIDGLNRRIGKRVNGTLQKRWVYMDQYRIAAELNASGTITKRFIYGSKGNIPDYMIASGVKYRIISDHLGSPRLVVKQSDGTITQRMNHDEYGRVTEDTSPGYLPFGFAGGLYDNQTSLVRFGARDFDPEIGRWTSKDPIRFGGRQTNLYGYTFADPVNFIDPTGNFGFGGAIIGAIVGGTSGWLTAINTHKDPLQGLLIGAGIGAASGFTGAYLAEGAAALGVGVGGQIFAGTFGAFQAGFTGTLLTQQLTGQKPSVSDAAKAGGMCAVGGAGGMAMGVGYSAGARLAIDGAVGTSLIPVEVLLAK